MPASVDEIKDYLEGYDDQQYIVSVESSYHENKVHLIIHTPEGKKIEKHRLKPFIWMKQPDMSILYGGDRKLIRQSMRNYKIKFITLSTEYFNTISLPLCFEIAIGILIVFGPGSEPSTFVTSFSSSVAETVVNATASRAS